MKKDDLYQMAQEICRDVLDKNKDIIDERITKSLERNADSDGKISPTKAASTLSAVSMTLCPELSAVITARLLVALGLVTLEEDE